MTDPPWAFRHRLHEPRGHLSHRPRGTPCTVAKKRCVQRDVLPDGVHEDRGTLSNGRAATQSLDSPEALCAFLRLSLCGLHAPGPHTAAGLVYPNLRVGEGIRRLGHSAYETTFNSPIGKTVFSLLGWDLDRVLEMGPKGYFLAVNFGKVTSEKRGTSHWLFHLSKLPAFMETFQVGVLEGAVQWYGHTPRLRVRLQDLANATIEVRWT